MKKRMFLARAINKTKRLLTRQYKQIRQTLLFPDISASPLFILGVQRSGTNMLLQMVDKSLEVFSYNEDNNKAFKNYRIRNQKVRDRLLRNAHCKWVAFKPICDLQHSITLLDSHPSSKAIWIFRDYRDVTNSAIKKWGREQYRHIERLVTDDNCSHWFCENVDDMTRGLIRPFYSNLTDHEAGVLKWYIRNQWFFKLDLLSRQDQVLLIQYEELAAYPVDVGHRICDFLKIDFEPRFVSDVHTSSIKKNSFHDIRPEIQQECNRLMEQLVLGASNKD